MTSQRRTLTLVVMCVGMFLVLLDVTVVNVGPAAPARRSGRRRRQPAVDRRWLRRRPGLADAPVRRPRRPPRAQARRARGARRLRRGVARGGAGARGVAARRRARRAGRRRRAALTRHPGGRLARVSRRGRAGARHRHLGRDLVARAPGRGHRRRRPRRRPGLALGLPGQPPAHRRSPAGHGARRGRVARDGRPRARCPGCRSHGGAAGNGDLGDHRALARGRRGGRRAARGAGGGRAPAAEPMLPATLFRRPDLRGPPTPSRPR